MTLRRNIVLSLFVHAVLIAAFFALYVSDTVHRITPDHIVVSLFKEVTSIVSKTSHMNVPPISSRKKEIQRDDEIVVVSNTASKEEKSDTSNSLMSETPQMVPSKGIQEVRLGVSLATPSHREAGSTVISYQSREVNDASLLTAIRTAIEKAKSYPFLARKRGMEGTVLFSFKIDSKGLPRDIRILQSSGYQILDGEVPKMLRKASPFPAVKGEIVIPITFKLTASSMD